TEGAVATSTPLRRRWTGPDGSAHHLVDPATGLPHARAARQVTVVAADGWWAEAAATALTGPGARLPEACAALVVDHDGTVRHLGGIERYLR
ncbi:MAG: FAD:protein FMN transferase, partial [Actinomycetota bacterium]